jgi:hypothetical protein
VDGNKILESGGWSGAWWLVAGGWWIRMAGAPRRQSFFTNHQPPITNHCAIAFGFYSV